jgi:uncharacterized protein DUF3810
VLAVAAVAAAFVPLPPAAVERVYSMSIYPLIQNPLTWISSLVPFALLDVAAVAGAIGWLLFVGRRWRRQGRAGGVRSAAVSLLTCASCLYLVFLALWGFNYRRVSLETKLAFDPSRLTREATLRLAETSIERMNSLEAMKTARSNSEEVLILSFADAQRHLGASRTARPARPKRSMVSFYLLRAGIDGMMNPFFLEIILNPGVLPVEYPFTVTHEWAHLAGYADESEANFVAWMTCVGADERAQYSAWLEAYQYAAAALTRDERRELQRRLAPGVVADLRAIANRLGRADPAVSSFARNVYDSYLRAQGVDEGIASYGAMLRLMLGTTFENGWVPRLRN